MSAPGDGPTDLDELVFRVLELQEEGRADALEVVCAEHPEHAEALRARVEALGASGLLEPSAREFPERIGDFRLIEQLGQGGMGVVYRAEQISLSRTVALKLVRPELLYFAGARERFQREVLAVSRMSHPGIVPVFTVGEENGVPFFAMELVHGVSLADVLADLQGRDPATLTGADLEAALHARAGAPSGSASDARSRVFAGTWEQACVRVVQQVADALEHAHLREVLHRDVKPSNVMLTPSGRALLVDFGLSSMEGASRLTRSGSQLGSVPYMPPEAIDGRKDALDERTDVYGLGVTLYELLTLRLPYEGKSMADLSARITAGHCTPPRRLNARVSWEVETCCLTAMELDPARRYAGAGAFARDLANALARRPIEARRAGPVLRARRTVERHPAWSVGLALGLLLVVGGPLVYARQERVRRLDVEEANRQTQQANADLAAALEQVSRERDGARRQFERAERNLDSAFEAVDLMLSRVGGRDLDGLPRIESVRRELLERALTFHTELLAQAGEDAERNLGLARAHYRVGVLLADLARFEQVEQHLDQALAVLDALPDDEPKRRLRGELLTLRGNVALRQSQEVEASRAYADAEALLAADEGAAAEGAERAAVLFNQGVAHKRALRFDEAREALRHAQRIERALAAQQPDGIERLHRLALTTMELGIVERESGDSEAALELLAEAFELQSLATTASPTTERYVVTTGKIHFELGQAAMRAGRNDLARPALRDAADVLEPLALDHPDVPLYAGLRGAALATLSGLTAIDGDLERSCDELREAAAVFAQLVERFPQVPDHKANLAQVQASLARRLARLGRVDEALETAEGALGLQERACEQAGDHPSHREQLAARRVDLALVLALADDLEGAREVLRSARDSGALDLEKLLSDADFAALADDPRAVELLGD